MSLPSRRFWPFSLLLLLIVGSGVLWLFWPFNPQATLLQDSPRASLPPSQSRAAYAAPVVSPRGLTSLAPLVKTLTPAVVNIRTTQVVQGEEFATGPRHPMQEFSERFFGLQRPPAFRQSLGSGFIIDPAGYIVTNNHVIANARTIGVRLADGREFNASVLGTDPQTDLALLRIKAEGDLPAVPLGDSEATQVGDWVIAIGNPFGLGQTVTTGIISAKGRVIGAGPYDDFLQTDAAINPGNSGGPLFNLNGEVIGINTAIVASGQGIGFAIPSQLAKTVIAQLKSRGRVVRGWLGVYVQPLTPPLAQSLGLEKLQGALVADVVAGGPAAEAGVQPGDVIVALGGQPVQTATDLPRLVAEAPVGKAVPVKLIRRGKTRSVAVTIGERPAE
ncbi:MAG: Do family serine endopeptidase [Nitrospinota bacterium]|nr:MAG: Do family serine endopeptidase [Nitrospinota bacterium]